jgi:MurNAc alpha-1-phosphate uridylyltransferase
VVNVHHLADSIEAHLKRRRQPRILISDERAALLETGGGVRKALPLLGFSSFLLVNSDSLWLDGKSSNLARLARAFDDARMDILLLLAPAAGAHGYQGRGDYRMDADGRLERRGDGASAPFVYAGAGMLTPRIFADAPEGAFPLTRLFDAAEARGRLFGLELDGMWMHVGTPEAIAAAEALMRRFEAIR